MPKLWSHGGKLLLAIFTMVAMTCAVVVFSSSRASAAVAHTTTPNPTCGSKTGYKNDHLTGCAQASSAGITFTFGGYTDYSGNLSNAFEISGNGQPPIDGLASGSAPSWSYFVSLPAGEFIGWFEIAAGDGNPVTVAFDLVVGGSNPPPPPPTATRVVGMAATPSGNGYWLVSSNGAVSAHGDAVSYGDMSAAALNKPIVGMAPTADGKGYWLDASDGGIFSFGDAQFYGSMGGSHLNQSMVGMAATTGGHGYWTVAADGGIFSFGDAAFHGSTGNIHLNQPVVGMAADMATGGYWLVASDGGIFAFNAPFYGSTGNSHLNEPIVEMEAAPNGSGYRFVASDGGIFSFNLPFEGSLGANPPPDPIAGMAAHSSDGYWLVEQNGTVHNFGSAPAV